MNRYKINEFAHGKKLDADSVKSLFCRRYEIPLKSLMEFKISRLSLDSRKANRPVYKYNLEFSSELELSGKGVKKLDPEGFASKPKLHWGNNPVAVIGAGPAGMFAAYALAKKGFKVHVYERGSEVKKRAGDVRKFVKQDIFNAESNILFGEGGAGTFSDGKLTCRNNNPYTQQVLDIWVECGAVPEIAYLSRPHIGTDRLQFLVSELREKSQALGVEYFFDAKVDGIVVTDRKIKGLNVFGEFKSYDNVIWSAGHSARDLYKNLWESGVALEPKSFSVGVRVEHPQSLINAQQLGERVDAKAIGAAEYYLTFKSEQHRAYSFCMCPGGVVVPCADSPEGICVNGMSYSSRATRFANSAIVVPVDPSDFEAGLPPNAPREKKELWGMYYQENMEHKAFQMAGGDFSYPAQTVAAYLAGKKDEELPPSSFQRKLVPCDLYGLFTKKVNAALKAGLKNFDKKIPGFIEQGLMIGPESRTSSPLRISRNPETLESTNTKGLFPLAEGAGYSGGIVSSAADGLKLADLVAHAV